VTTQSSDPRAVLDAVGVLGDESRWKLFSFVRRARRAVTREEAAERVGISRKLAAFHLDKMVAAGLLHARYESTGESPRVGRRPKVYEPVDADLTVSIPGRQYQLLADLLIETVLNESGEEAGPDAASRMARERGVALGAAQPVDAAGRRGAAALPMCGAMLEAHGYEPAMEETGVRLRNCPFHPFADKAPELVCRMNHAFLAGYLEGLEVADVEAVLAPTPGECCVRISAAT